MIEKFDGDHELFHANPEAYSINMQGDHGLLGKLTYGPGGELTFEGSASDSAKVFFEHVIGCNNKVLQQALELLKVANCPECEDNSGAYCNEVPGYDGEGDIEMQQCRWCTEKAEMFE